METVTRILDKIRGIKKKSLNKLWTLETHDITYSDLILDKKNDENFIYFTTYSGKLYKIDDMGKIISIYEIPEKTRKDKFKEFLADNKTINATRCTPTLIDINLDQREEIIFGDEAGTLFALKDDFSILWLFKTTGNIRTKPLCVDINNDGKNEIIFGSNDNNIFCLDNNGKILWQYSTDSGVEANPTYFLDSRNKIQTCFGSISGKVISFSSEGKVNWEFKTGGSIIGKPEILEYRGRKSIIVSSHDKNIYLIDEDGKLVWKYSLGGIVHNNIEIHDINNDNKPEILISSDNNQFTVLSVNGARLWNFETDYWNIATPVLTDFNNDKIKEIVVGSFDTNLYILDSEPYFILDKMPGLSGIILQSGVHCDSPNEEPGQYYGKKIIKKETDGMINSCIYIHEKNILVISTHEGKISAYKYAE